VAETPIITPAQFLSVEGVASTDNPCRAAIVAFCPFHDMRDKARARPLAKSLFTHLDLAHQYQGLAGGHPVLMVDTVYGGPVCATVLEEMAHLGVKYAVGYGYSGSLRQDIAPGSLVLASSALVSDGTSREYLSAPEVQASVALIAEYDRLPGAHRDGVCKGKAWTTDAIYREYPSKTRFWAQAGADFVNMDAAPFYAVSRTVGIEALYFSLISDYVGGETWHQQFRNLGKSRQQLQEMIRVLVTRILGSLDEQRCRP
jgi:uridine phosphorylase